MRGSNRRISGRDEERGVGRSVGRSSKQGLGLIMNKNWSKRIGTVFCAILLLSIFSASIANAASIRLVETYWEDCSFGPVGVGHFEINGKLAFCMEHAKTTPSTGVETSEMVYDNAAVQKVLYYGYGGPAQWSGFTSQKNGVMVTSLMLSEVYTTAHKVGTYDEIRGLAAFRNYLATQPAPDLELRFDKQEVKAYYDKVLNAERTENITVLGRSEGKLTVTIPEGYLLHNNKSGAELSGSVALTAGDSFYIKTAGEYSTLDFTEIKGRNAKLKPIVFVTESGSLQDLTRLEVVEDTAETSKLKIEWIGKLDLRITKTDIESGDRVNGAIFKLREYDINGKEVVDDKQGYIYTANDNGSVLVKDRLQCGRTYTLEEINAPYAYRLNTEQQSFEVTGELKEHSLNFENEKQRVYLIINKLGKKNEISGGRIEKSEVPLEGVKFEIMAATKILEWGTRNVMYDAGEVVAEIVTDENGIASTEGLPPGKYTVSEIETAPGYEIDREAKTYDLRVETKKSELRHTINVVNEPQETEVTVVKYDEETNKKLEGAYFEIANEEGAVLKVGTERNGKTVLRNLPEGDYTFKEVQAPEGYSVDNEVQEFTIGYEEEERSVTLSSYDEKLEAVDTGDENALVVYFAIGAAAILLTGGLCKKRTSKECNFNIFK